MAAALHDYRRRLQAVYTTVYLSNADIRSGISGLRTTIDMQNTVNTARSNAQDVASKARADAQDIKTTSTQNDVTDIKRQMQLQGLQIQQLQQDDGIEGEIIDGGGPESLNCVILNLRVLPCGFRAATRRADDVDGGTDGRTGR